MMSSSLTPPADRPEQRRLPWHWRPVLERKAGIGWRIAGEVGEGSVVAVVEHRVEWRVTAMRSVKRREPGPMEFHLRYLRRLPLELSYPQQCEAIADLQERLDGEDVDVLADKTACGDEVFREIHERIDLIRAATLTGEGGKARRVGTAWVIPDGQLLSVVQAQLHHGRLKIPRALAEGPMLVRELQQGRGAAGRTGAPPNAYVVAVGLALWAAIRPSRAQQVEVLGF